MTNLKLFEIDPIKIQKKEIVKERKKVTPFNNRRYKLHQKIKNICNLYSRKRLIKIPDGYVTSNKYITELISKFHYNVQYHIPIPNINEIEVNEPELVINKN